MIAREPAVTHFNVAITRSLERSRSLALAAIAMLGVASAANAAGCASKAVTAAVQPGTLVEYTEEQGGIVYRHTLLIISTRGRAAVRFEKCSVRFQLDGVLWRNVKAALKQTDLHAAAGDHGPATRRAEESTWVIVVGHDAVRITASSMPPELRASIEPLLKVLEEVISAGKRSMPRSCADKQTIEGAVRHDQASHSDGRGRRSDGR